MRFPVVLLLAAGLLSGCGTLIPKRVELLQDKVKTFPVPTAKHEEAVRQAVALAETQAREAARLASVIAVASVDSNTVVVATEAAEKAEEAADLDAAVGRKLGPPENQWIKPVSDLVLRLDASTARFNETVREFAHSNNENAGKKIEGTGLVSVPYFVWLGGVALVLVVGYIALRILLQIVAVANPPIGVGMQLANVGAKTAGQMVSQIIRGGEAFKARLDAELGNPELAAKVKKLFRDAHRTEQSPEVQQVVRNLTETPH